MSLSTISIKRPVLTIVLNLTIILFGIIGYSFLGIREFPSIDPAQISIRTDYAGANSDIVESQITEPIEKAIENVVAGLRVHLSPSAAEIDALKRRLEPAQAQKGGEVTFVAAIGGGREIELRLPGRYTLDAALRGALKIAPGVALLEDV